MTRKYMIIGEGIAGATAAKTIRENDEDAEIKVFTDDNIPLYNRIMLKSYMKGSLPSPKFTMMRDTNWYDKRDIDIYLETRVKSVDTESKTVSTGEEEFEYDRLLLAMGGSPRRIVNEDYENLHYMWTLDDAERIKSAAEESEKAVVVGGGLLGIDLAVAFAKKGAETDYLIRDNTWWNRGLDKEGAEIIHRKLEELGVNVVLETGFESFETDINEITSVNADTGETFDCDTVAVAIGQTPNSNIVDVEKNDADMIMADSKLRTSAEDVFAAGNMVEYSSPVFERRIVNGAWDHSEAMGEIAGRNMVGEETEFDFVNTYGVGHFDVQFLAIGDWTGDSVSRKYSDDEYRRLFFKENRLVGAVMIGYTKGQEELKRMIKSKDSVESKEELLDKSYWKS